MPYMLTSKSRGRLEEPLGACCSSCAQGALAGPGASLMSAITKPGTALNTIAVQAVKTGKPMPFFNQPAVQTSASPGIAPASSSKTMLVVALAGAIGLGAYILKTRRRGRR